MWQSSDSIDLLIVHNDRVIAQKNVNDSYQIIQNNCSSWIIIIIIILVIKKRNVTEILWPLLTFIHFLNPRPRPDSEKGPIN